MVLTSSRLLLSPMISLWSSSCTRGTRLPLKHCNNSSMTPKEMVPHPQRRDPRPNLRERCRRSPSGPAADAPSTTRVAACAACVAPLAWTRSLVRFSLEWDSHTSRWLPLDPSRLVLPPSIFHYIAICSSLSICLHIFLCILSTVRMSRSLSLLLHLAIPRTPSPGSISLASHLAGGGGPCGWAFFG